MLIITACLTKKISIQLLKVLFKGHCFFSFIDIFVVSPFSLQSPLNYINKFDPRIQLDYLAHHPSLLF